MYTLFNMHTQSPSAYIWSARLAQDLMGSFIWGKTRKETGGTQVNVTQHFSFIWDITALISQIIFTPACHICYSTLAVNPCDVSICRNRCVSGSRNLSVVSESNRQDAGSLAARTTTLWEKLWATYFILSLQPPCCLLVTSLAATKDTPEPPTPFHSAPATSQKSHFGTML